MVKNKTKVMAYLILVLCLSFAMAVGSSVFAGAKTVKAEPSVWDGTVATAYAGGSGTEEDPYLIATASQLAYLSQQVNSGNAYEGEYFVQTNDINLNCSMQRQWTPIGSMLSDGTELPFAGSYNGGEYEITGLFVANMNSHMAGLFGYLKGALVVNVNLTANALGSVYVGGIAGVAYDSIIALCNVQKGTLNRYMALASSMYAGGICGFAYNTDFSECTASGAVAGKQYVGGICGFGQEITVAKCENNGSISPRESGTTDEILTCFGGIVGMVESSIVDQCENNGDVLSGSYENVYYFGGIGAYSSSSSFNQCVNNGAVAGCSYVGGILAAGDSSTYIYESVNNGGLSTPVQSYYVYMGGIAGFLANGGVQDCVNNATVNGGYINGSAYGEAVENGEGESFEIVSGNVYVAGVIGYSDTCTVNRTVNNGNVVGYNYVAGICGAAESTNIYNSECYGKIEGDIYVGGFVGGGLGLIVANCYSGAELYGYVAGLGSIVGYNDSTQESKVFNCVHKGSMVVPPEMFGMFVGANSEESACADEYNNFFYVYGAVNAYCLNGEETDAYTAEQVVNVLNEYLDSLVGVSGFNYWALNEEGEIVLSESGLSSDYAYSGGTGSEEDPYLVSTAEDLRMLATIVNGGVRYEDMYFELTNDIDLEGVTFTPIGSSLNNHFRGHFEGNGFTVSNLYVETAQQSSLFGIAYGSTIQNLTVTGVIVGGNHAAAVVSYIEEGQVLNCKADAEISGYYLVGGVVGYAVNSLVDGCIFEGSITGTQCPENFADNASANKYLAGVVAYADGCTVQNCENYANVNGVFLASGVVSAASTSSVVNCRNYGNVQADDYAAGVVGYLGNSTVEGVANYGKIRGNSIVGGAVGLCATSVVNNSINGGEVYAYDVTLEDGTWYYSTFIGGVVSYADEGSEINACANSATVTGTYLVGGVAGTVWNSIVKDSSNSGSIYSRIENPVLNEYGSVEYADYASYVGGITGAVAMDLTDTVNTESYVSGSTNTGAVYGMYFVGGIAGIVQEGSAVYGCNNAGAVSSVSISSGDEVGESVVLPAVYMGGVAGMVYTGTLENCYNTANVKGFDYVGGVAGFIYINATVDYCGNSGKVIASDAYAGGVVGASDTSVIRNCYSLGDVEGGNGVAGIAAELVVSSVINCYATGNVKGADYVGGMVASVAGEGTTLSKSYLENCYFSGSVTATAGDGDVIVPTSGLSNAQVLEKAYLYYVLDGWFVDMSEDPMTEAELIENLNEWVGENSLDGEYSNWYVSATYPGFTEYKLCTIQFVDTDGTVFATQQIYQGGYVEDIGLPAGYVVPDGYTYTGWKLGDTKYVFNRTPVSDDMTLTIYLKAERYRATLYIDGQKSGIVYFTMDDTVLDLPEIPARAGYSAAWGEYTLEAKDIKVYAEYTLIEYKATFVDWKGRVISEQTFTVENMQITEPELPRGAEKWEDYTLTLADITIEAVKKQSAGCGTVAFDSGNATGIGAAVGAVTLALAAMLFVRKKKSL